MKLTRQEDVSLYMYLRDTVVGPQYMELSEEETASLSAPGVWDVSYQEELKIHPFKRGDYSGLGRGILYFDVADTCSVVGSEQSCMVTVYSGSLVLPITDYQVNYKTGQLLTSLDISDFYIDYYWQYVSIIDAWPSDDVPALPIISIEMYRAESLPLQLGGGDIRGANWNIEIFANNKGERDDLMDVVFEGLNLKRCSIYTFSGGLPLLRSGLYNQEFSIEKNSDYPSLFFENVEKSLTGLPNWGFYENETINKYRASITFDTRAYKQ